MFESLRNKVKTLTDMVYAQYNHYQVKNRFIKWSSDGQYIGQVSTESPEFKYILPGFYHSPTNSLSGLWVEKGTIILWESRQNRLYYKELYPDGNTKIFSNTLYEGDITDHNNKKILVQHTQYWDQDGNEKDLTNLRNLIKNTYNSS